MDQETAIRILAASTAAGMKELGRQREAMLKRLDEARTQNRLDFERKHPGQRV
jgi:hypothetical protein